MKKSRESDNAALCDAALASKEAFGFERGREEECRKVEKFVDSRFSNAMQVRRYDRFARRIYRRYQKICAVKPPKMAYKIAEYEKND